MMKSILRTSLVCAATFFVPLITGAADVSDGAGFFSADALSKANGAIRDLEHKSGHQLRIETFATVPGGKAETVSKMSKQDREEFFVNWEHERVESTKSTGLYILICKSPAHVRVWAGNPLQLAGFHQAQARAVRDALLKDLNAKEYDKALADTVAEATTIFAGLKPGRHGGAVVPHQSTANHATPHHAPVHAAPQAGFGGLFWVIAIIIGGVLLFSLISRMFSGGGGYGQQPGYGAPGMGAGPGYGGGGYGGGGGGGFFKSMAGGIFGAVAGNWLYNQFAQPHASAGDTWSQSDAPVANDSDRSDDTYSGGTDFGGGDFGDSGGGDSGGGDFGDSGGGDFGGGDF